MLTKNVILCISFSYLLMNATEKTEVMKTIINQLSKKRQHTHSSTTPKTGHVANLEDTVPQAILNCWYNAAYQFMFGSEPDDQILKDPAYPDGLPEN